MPHFSMPPVRITISVQGDGFVSQSFKNAFVLPSQEFTLDDAYSEERVLRAPSLLLRLVAPGNKITNPDSISPERPYQHIFSHQVPVEQMMRCFDQGETLRVHAYTLEDGRKFDITLELGDNSRKSKQKKLQWGQLKTTWLKSP